MYPFTYTRPQTLADALAALAVDPQSKPLAGGMTLIPTLKHRLARPSQLVDVSRLSELKGIALDGGHLRIGAATSHAHVAASALVREQLPALAELAGLIGDAQVRQRGTIGGSIANNDPAADYPAAMLGLDATIQTDQRQLSAAGFFTGMFATALRDGEIVVAVQCPLPRRASYAKHRHPASGYAVVGVFVADTEAGPRVALTGAAPCVMRWTEAEQRLATDGWSALALDGLRLSASGLNDDVGASAAYRAHLAGVLLRRAVAQCADPALAATA